MDPVGATMVRASLVWLVGGVVIGAVMLTYQPLPDDWRLWLATSHPHMLFVGWFLQFAVGIAYWLLPRQRSLERPLGYAERRAFVAVLALNLGLGARIVAEPLERSGHGTDVPTVLLTISATLQVVGVALFVSQLWPRTALRRRRDAAQP